MRRKMHGERQLEGTVLTTKTMNSVNEMESLFFFLFFYILYMKGYNQSKCIQALTVRSQKKVKFPKAASVPPNKPHF